MSLTIRQSWIIEQAILDIAARMGDGQETDLDQASPSVTQAELWAIRELMVDNMAGVTR